MYSAACQFQHEHLVEAGNGGEVERVETLHRREAGGSNPPLDGPALTVDELELDQPEQVARVVHALAGAFARHLVIFPQHGRQLQPLEMMREQDLRRATHSAQRRSIVGRAAHAASTA